MKTTFPSVVICSFTLASAALAGDFQAVETGPHHRVMQRTIEQVLPNGRVTRQTERYIALAAGMNVWREGRWVLAHETLELLPDSSGAFGRGAAHSVVLPADLCNYPMEVTTPDGVKLKTRPLAIGYSDGTNSVILAELKDCTGELLDTGNSIIWRDAFDELQADIVATYSRGGFECDLLFRDTPPDPARWGFGPDVKLQLLSELYETGEPAQETAIMTATNRPAPLLEAELPQKQTADFTYYFGGTMRMGAGRAFGLTPQAKGERSFRVSKRIIHAEGRMILIEELRASDVAKEMKTHQASVTVPGKRTQVARADRNRVSGQAMPGMKVAVRNASQPVLLTKATSQERSGFLLDYYLRNSATNVTLSAGETYLVEGPYHVDGFFAIESGAVIKFTNTAQAKITFSGPLACRTTRYAPALLTSMHDNSSGITVDGSTGTPQRALGTWLEDASDAQNTFQNLRFAYAGVGASVLSGLGNEWWHCQFVNCGIAVQSSASVANFFNTLFTDCGTVVSATGSTRMQNATADRCGTLVTNYFSANFVTFTNCLLSGITNLNSSFIFSNCGQTSSGTDWFTPVGAGGYYLKADSDQRHAGSTNIHGSLLADLKQMTTQPPLVISNSMLSMDTLFAPQAERDSGTPDRGYHYPVLDYAIRQMRIPSGYTVTVLPGTALATFGTYGIGLSPGAKLLANGTPSLPIQIVRYDTVQENPISVWNGQGSAITANWTGATGGAGEFRFAKWSMLGRGSKHLDLEAVPFGMTFRDCELSGGQIYTLRPDVRFTNSLLSGVYVSIDDDSVGQEENPVFQNCTIVGGECLLYHTASGVWTFQDTIFQNIAFTNVIGAFTNDYNAYSGCDGRLSPSGTHDRIGTVPFETGPLGRYYLPTNSALIHAGSTSATNLGLYHFTTGVEQRKAGTNTVSIGYHYVALGEPAINTPWVNDSPLPTGAQPLVVNDTWSWLTTPSPAAGSQFHRSDLYNGIHQHYFENATSTLTFGSEDVFFVYVRLGYTNLPGELMLQWQASDSTYWYHRAYWGSDQISGWGSRRYIGALPVTNAWVRLEVPARDVNLVGKTVVGVAFTLNGGTVDWDYAGKRSVRAPADLDGDGIPDAVEDWNGNAIYDAVNGESDWTTYKSANDLGTTGGLKVFTPLR